MKKEYEIVPLLIVGAGPAGYAASIYASRYRIQHMIFGKMPGGLITEAHKVCNYPGEHEIGGLDLGMKFREHAVDILKATELMTEIIKLEIIEEGGQRLFKLIDSTGEEYFSYTVVLATGTERRKLGLPNEKKFLGKGLAYCATCDAAFYKDKVVGVVGGANAATTAAILLAEGSKKVYLIYRKDKLRGEEMWKEQVLKNDKIEVIYETEVVELLGEDSLEKIRLSKPHKDSELLELDGLFIEIGSKPDTTLFEDLSVETDKYGYIEVHKDQSTNIEGLYAAGDITTASNNFRQVVTAASEGAIAADAIYKYLQTKNLPTK